jgi:hypothetical protein
MRVVDGERWFVWYALYCKDIGNVCLGEGERSWLVSVSGCHDRYSTSLVLKMRKSMKSRDLHVNGDKVVLS